MDFATLQVEWEYGSCLSISISYKGMSRRDMGKGGKFGHNYVLL